MVEIKSAQYVYDIELHFTEKEKRTQTRELKSVAVKINIVSQAEQVSVNSNYSWTSYNQPQQPLM